MISASVVILTAGYILWTLQRVYLGPEYKGPHGESSTPITARELAIARSAAGAGDPVRRLSEGGVPLHEAEREQDGGRAGRPGPATSKPSSTPSTTCAERGDLSSGQAADA